MTLLRFDGDHGGYELAVGQGQSVQGPETLNNYVWLEVEDWPRWERALIEGPFIHHMAMNYGNYTDVIAEAVKYIPNLKLVDLDHPSR